MVNLVRKYQQPLMIVVTVLIIICFAWLYNDYRVTGPGDTSQVGKAYDRTLTTADVSRSTRKFDVARQLMMFDLLQTLVGEARSMDEAQENFFWNGVVLRHEAGKLGIEPTDEDVVAFVQELPVFQTNGVYDSQKYAAFSSNALAPRGMTDEQFEELVRDQLRLQKVKTLLGSTIEPAPAEVRAAFERRNQKTELSFVKLALDDFVKATQVTDEDVSKLFEERKDTLKSDEKRKVKYAAFTLPQSDKPIVGKERVEAMSKLADQAQEVAQAMLEKDAKFEEVAQKFGGEVKETPEFTLNEPPKELGQGDEAARAAFEKLTLEQPNSDVVMTDKGYYVLQLTGITPPQPLSLEEAKPKLIEQIKDERGREAMNLKIAEIRQKIDAALKEGKTFEEAATAAGAKPQKVPAFSLAEPPPADVPEARVLMGRSQDLGEGQLSEPVPVMDGVALVRVEKRLPPDEQKFETEKKQIVENISRAKVDAAFEQWLKNRRAAANIMTPSAQS